MSSRHSHELGHAVEEASEGEEGKEIDWSSAEHGTDETPTSDPYLVFGQVKLLAMILSYLGVTDISGCLLTNRQMSTVVEAMHLWESALDDLLGDSMRVTRWPLPTLPQPTVAETSGHGAGEESPNVEERTRTWRGRTKGSGKRLKVRSSSLTSLQRFSLLLQYITAKARRDHTSRAIILSVPREDFLRCSEWRNSFEEAADSVVQRRFLRWDVMDRIVDDSAYVVTMRPHATQTHLTMRNVASLKSAVGAVIPSFCTWVTDESSSPSTSSSRHSSLVPNIIEPPNEFTKSSELASGSKNGGGDNSDGSIMNCLSKKVDTPRHEVGRISGHQYDTFEQWALSMTASFPPLFQYDRIGIYGGCFAFHLTHMGGRPFVTSVDFMDGKKVLSALTFCSGV